MNKVFGIGILAIAAAMTMGCAANQQCLRKVDELEAQSRLQDRILADLEARQAKLAAEKSEGDLSALSHHAMEMAGAAWSWASIEIPAAYHATDEKVSKVRKCYTEIAEGQPPQSFSDYQAIAKKCWNDTN